MLLQDYFKYFDIWSAIESGLYYIVVGYLVLIFFYFLLMRYRTSKRFYWLYFSFLFLFLAIGRFFFIVYYFYAPELDLPSLQIVNILMIYYRLATFSTWLGIACLMGVLGILIFPPLTDVPAIQASGFKGKVQNLFKKKFASVSFKSLLIIIPIIVAIAALILPDPLFMDPAFEAKYGIPHSFFITIFGYPIGRALLNFILLPIFVAIIPFLYIYLATRTFGVLRRSYALNAIGFLIYFSGRILDGLFGSLGWSHVSAIAPPLLILLSLLIIVIANNYEQLK
jgi:hypothetical protein